MVVKGETNWLISVDDHVLEPATVWSDRLPARYQEQGPRLERDEQGEAWFYEDKRIPTTGLSAAAGRSKDEFSPMPITYDEMRPGCYDAKARIADMDRDHVLASLCFPSFPRFCGQIFYEAEDRELALLCVRAYNDWMIDEWAGAVPGRFIPLIILPLWSPELARQEIHRTKDRGAKAIAFSENPYPLGLPSIHDASGYWEPVFQAAADTEMPLCTHLGSSSQLPQSSPDSPLLATLALTPLNVASTCIDWIFSGILPRYPKLKICLSEGGIGWIPYVLERCEYVLERQGGWAAKGDYRPEVLTGGQGGGSKGGKRLDVSVSPTQLFRDHIYGCFIDDIHGAHSIEEIGVDNVMIETDYPHTDSSWPRSLETARDRLKGYPDDVIHKVLRGNAERVFNFVPAADPAVMP